MGSVALVAPARLAGGSGEAVVKRSELRRGKPLERGTKRLARGKPLRQIGRRARAQADEREAMRQTVLAETGGVCVARVLLPEVECWGGTEIHELCERSTRPGVHLEAEFGVSCCHAHNSAINDRPTRAREVGLTFYSWQAEEARARAAVLRRSAW